MVLDDIETHILKNQIDGKYDNKAAQEDLQKDKLANKAPNYRELERQRDALLANETQDEFMNSE